MQHFSNVIPLNSYLKSKSTQSTYSYSLCLSSLDPIHPSKPFFLSVLSLSPRGSLRLFLIHTHSHTLFYLFLLLFYSLLHLNSAFTPYLLTYFLILPSSVHCPSFQSTLFASSSVSLLPSFCHLLLLLRTGPSVRKKRFYLRKDSLVRVTSFALSQFSFLLLISFFEF